MNRSFSLPLCGLIIISVFVSSFIACSSPKTITVTQPVTLTQQPSTSTIIITTTAPASTNKTTTYLPTTLAGLKSGYRIVISGTESFVTSNTQYDANYPYTNPTPVYTSYKTTVADITISGEYTQYDSLGSQTHSLSTIGEYIVWSDKISCRVQKTSNGTGTLTVKIYSYSSSTFLNGTTPLKSSSTDISGRSIDISYP